MARKDIPNPKDGKSPADDARGHFARTQHGGKSDGVASANPRARSRDEGADATTGTSGHGLQRRPGEGG